MNSPKDSDDENVFNFKSEAKSNNKPSTSPPNIKLEPPNIKLEPLTGQATTASKITIDNDPLPSGSGGSSVVALTAPQPEVILIEESQPLFDDCSETFCEKLELRLQTVETMASELKISDDDKLIANHRLSCRQCREVSYSISLSCCWKRFLRSLRVCLKKKCVCEPFVSETFMTP